MLGPDRPDAAPAALVARCLDSLEAERSLSKNTTRGYRQDLRSFLAWLEATGRASTLASLTRATLLEWRAFRAARVAPGTRAREWGAIRPLSAWLVREEILTADPARLIQSPKAPRPLPRAPGGRAAF